MADLYDPDLALAALALILDGQRPPFEGRVRARMVEALWFDSAEELADAGVDYFGPVARKRRRPLAGFSKGDVADTTNVVWLDLDPPPGGGVAGGAALVAQAGRWLDGMRALGLPPSVFVFSGRGAWAYWKLGRHVPQADAEALMRRLYARFRPGGSEHDIGRVARMPGSTNEKTGLEAFVMAIEDMRWDPDDLGKLLPEADTPSERDAARTAVEYERTLQPGGRLPAIELPDDLAEYVAASPTKREREARGIDGSALEQAIVARLVNAGCSDEQIALFFDHHRLPRHEEEKRRRRGNGWLAMSVANAREGMLPLAPSVCIGKGNLFPNGGAGSERELGWQARRWLILRDMPDGLRKLELVEWVKERFGIQRSQARRDLDSLEGGKGYIGAVADERDTRIKRVCRSDAGRERVDSWGGRLGCRSSSSRVSRARRRMHHSPRNPPSTPNRRPRGRSRRTPDRKSTRSSRLSERRRSGGSGA